MNPVKQIKLEKPQSKSSKMIKRIMLPGTPRGKIKSKLSPSHKKSKFYTIANKNIMKVLFDYIPLKTGLQIIKHSKKLQSTLNYSLSSYAIYSFLNKSRQKPLKKIIQLYDMLKNKYPSINEKDLAVILYNYYDWKEVTITTTYHPSLQYLVPLFKHSENKQIKTFKLSITNKKRFIRQDFTPLEEGLMTLVNDIHYKNKICQKANQDNFETIFEKFNLINIGSQEKKITIDISGIGTKNIKLDKAFCFISSIKNITSLTLSDCCLSDKVIEQLSEFCEMYTQLSKINFSKNNLSNLSLRPLTKILLNSNVKDLDLSENNYLGEEFIEALLGSSDKLIKLNISSMYRNDSNEIEFFFKNADKFSNLEELNLDNNVTDYKGIQKINYIDSFSKLRSLRKLCYCNHLIENTHDLEIIFSELGQLTNFSSISLLERNFTRVKQIFAKTRLKELTLIGCEGISDVFTLSEIKREFILEKLVLSSCIFIDNSLLILSKFLMQTPNIKHLDLSDSKVSIQEIVNSFQNLKQLEYLNLSSSVWTTKSVISFSNFLSEMTDLKNFDISSSEGIQCQELKLLFLSLLKLSNLKYLNLSKLKFDKDCGEILLKIFSKNIFINTLILNECNISNDLFIKLLSNVNLLINLRHMNFRNNKINESGIKALINNVVHFNNLKYANFMQLTGIAQQTKNDAVEAFLGIIYI